MTFLESIKMMVARIRELYGREILSLLLISILIALVVGAFFLSETLGWVAFYVYFVALAGIFASGEVWPFNHLSDGWVLIAILAGPITVAISIIGMVLWVAFAPFIMLRDALREQKKGRREERISPKAWVIGTTVYYLIWLIIGAILYSVLG